MLAVWLNLGWFAVAQAQETNSGPGRQERQQIAADAILLLRNGGALFVRLPSERNKINALRNMAEANPAQAARLQREIEKITTDNLASNQLLMQAFQESFKFCAVYFFYDYDTGRVRSADWSGVFLDMSGAPDPAIDPGSRGFLILSEGLAGESGRSSYIVMDEHLQMLPGPFPSSFRKNNFMNVILGVFDPTVETHRNHRKLTRKINKAFFRFYLSVS